MVSATLATSTRSFIGKKTYRNGRNQARRARSVGRARTPAGADGQPSSGRRAGSEADLVPQPIEHRLSHILSGTPAALAIDVYGDDLARLRDLARQIEAALRSVPGVRDVAANREVMVTSLPVRYRPQDLAAAGLTPAAAAEQLQQALYGETVAQVNQGVRRYDLVVRLAPEERAALLLHDVFACEYAELARILGKSEGACRQMVHRAHMRVRRDCPRFDSSV